MNCNKNCKICDNIVISTAVAITTVDGTNTLVITLPDATYNAHCKYCIVVAQAIPEAATINMPVAFAIGTGATVYPFINCNCRQVTACGIRSRTRYPVTVVTDAVGGVFRSNRPIECYPYPNLTSLPITQ